MPSIPPGFPPSGFSQFPSGKNGEAIDLAKQVQEKLGVLIRDYESGASVEKLSEDFRAINGLNFTPLRNLPDPSTSKIYADFVLRDLQSLKSHIDKGDRDSIQTDFGQAKEHLTQLVTFLERGA